MTGRASWTMDVMITAGEIGVGELVDWECTLGLDRDGDLFEVEFRDHAAGDGRMVAVCKGGRDIYGRTNQVYQAIWQAAERDMLSDGDRIRELADVSLPELAPDAPRTRYPSSW